MLEGKSLSCIVYLYQTLLCFLPICLFSQQTDVFVFKIYIQKTLSKNKLRMRLTVNYFLIDVKQIIYLSTLFAAEPEVMTT
jgi:hypothetical protein